MKKFWLIRSAVFTLFVKRSRITTVKKVFGNLIYERELTNKAFGGLELTCTDTAIEEMKKLDEE